MWREMYPDEGMMPFLTDEVRKDSEVSPSVTDSGLADGDASALPGVASSTVVSASGNYWEEKDKHWSFWKIKPSQNSH